MADPTVPPEAIMTAAEAIHIATCEYSVADCMEYGAHDRAAIAALEAAASHIRAAERQRFAAELLQLAGQLRKDHHG